MSKYRSLLSLQVSPPPRSSTSHLLSLPTFSPSFSSLSLSSHSNTLPSSFYPSLFLLSLHPSSPFKSLPLSSYLFCIFLLISFHFLPSLPLIVIFIFLSPLSLTLISSSLLPPLSSTSLLLVRRYLSCRSISPPIYLPTIPSISPLSPSPLYFPPSWLSSSLPSPPPISSSLSHSLSLPHSFPTPVYVLRL